MHHRGPQPFPDTPSAMLYGLLAGTQPMAPTASATTHLPPAVLTQFQHLEPKTPSMHSQPSFASTITPRFSSTGWQSSKTELHEHGCLRQRSRTTGYAEMTKLRGYSPPSNTPENTRELTDLKEMLKESDTDPGEDFGWKRYQHYSQPGVNDAQKPLISGSPPAVSVSASTATAHQSVISQDPTWFLQEQKALNEYYKKHQLPMQPADVNVSPSHHHYQKPAISISRESHKTVVSTDTMTNIDVQTLHKVLTNEEPPAPACMKCYSNLKPSPSPTLQSYSATPTNLSPDLSRVVSGSPSQNTEKSENVVFLRNYRGSQSPYNSLSSQSSEILRAALAKKSQSSNTQHSGQYRSNAKVEFLQVRNPQQMATYDSVSRDVENNDTVSQPQPPIYHYVYTTPDQQGQQPLHMHPQAVSFQSPQPPPEYSYGLYSGLLSPAPSPTLTSPASIPILQRTRSPTSQRPRPQSYVPLSEQPPIQLWSTPPEPYQPYFPLPSQPPQVLPTHPQQLTSPMSSFQLPPTPPTPPNEPRRFKHTSWPSNTIWVPGERPQPMPPLIPMAPTAEPPRFMPMTSAVPVSVNPFPPILFNTTYPGFEGFRGG